MRREDGFTLVELLTAVSIMAVVLGATLSLFEHFTVTTQRNIAQNDAQDHARTAVDRIVREMRNHGAAAPDQELGIDRATETDLIFQTVDRPKPAGSANSRNVRRVRYCFDSFDPANGRLWFQSQSWTTATTPALPPTASCPSSGWDEERLLVEHIVNRYNGQNRPVFSPDSTQASHVSSIRTSLWIDMDPLELPAEQQLATSIFLRNQNQAPEAAFTFLVSQNGSVVLNATGSSDPEGERIKYTWYQGSTIIGEGLTATWPDPGSGSYTVTLTVTDQSGLNESTSQTVVVP